jgi:cytochrome c oxidase subunit 2
MVVIGLIGCAIGIPIALVIPWFPTDASTQAHHIRTLYDVLLIATVPVFVLVETVVLYSVWKFRMKPGEEEKDGPPIHGNTRLEVVWTAVPAVLIVSLCTYAYTVLRSNEKAHQGETIVNVTERQFAFEFSYPQANGRTIVSSDLYLAQNQPVKFQIRSLDVIHSFFVPQFSEKIDAVPGITTDLRVTPTRLGNYPAECTELCGAGHSFMRAPVHVVTPAAYRTWIAHQKPNAPPPIGTPPPSAAEQGEPGAPPGAPPSSDGNVRPTQPNASAPASSGSSSSSGSTSSGASTSTTTSTTSTSTTSTTSTSGNSAATSPAAGKAVFTGTAGCSGCHTLAAAGATGTIGPNLDQRLHSDCATAQSMKLRGATLDECIHTAITDPYKYIPSGYQAGVMPSNFSQRLTATQIQALVNFLSSVTK